MVYEKYSVTHYSVNAILGLIESNVIAIPEIQRPFVWKPKHVRDFIDSLYNGYPTGYLIIWQNPNVKLKTGGESIGKKILIDGQQRVTSLMTAILGYSVLNDEYEEKVIRIDLTLWPRMKRIDLLCRRLLILIVNIGYRIFRLYLKAISIVSALSKIIAGKTAK